MKIKTGKTRVKRHYSNIPQYHVYKGRYFVARTSTPLLHTSRDLSLSWIDVIASMFVISHVLCFMVVCLCLIALVMLRCPVAFRNLHLGLCRKRRLASCILQDTISYTLSRPTSVLYCTHVIVCHLYFTLHVSLLSNVCKLLIKPYILT